MSIRFFMAVIYVSTISLITSSGHAEPLIPLKADAVTYLYGTKASATEGKVARRNGNFLRITGPTKMEWMIKVSATGAYEVNITHGVKSAAEGNQISIASGNSTLSYTLLPTQGAWGPGSYERILLTGTLDLKEGNQLVTLTIPETATGDPVMDFRCLELIPVAAKSIIQADKKDALRSRANTDWLVKAGYGLMFHWTSRSVNEDGSIKPFYQAVEDFDMDSFITMVESTGAGYVLFTVGHAEPYCPAPLTSWEKYHPGHTTRRDLIAEMSDALGTKGIKLMCYFPTHIVGKRGRVTGKTFAMINHEVMTEFGKRYGEKVVGYWFDGWYQCFEEYPDVSFTDFFNACKVGNPNRIIALNSWIYPAVTEWQEYWAGENASPVALPEDGTYERGPGKGLRFQSLLIMEPYWVQRTVEMPEPRFNSSQLSQYIRNCMENGGAVTINLGIYQDGTVGDKALQVMREVKNIIRNDQ